jgi:hypothetical protein
MFLKIIILDCAQESCQTGKIFRVLANDPRYGGAVSGDSSWLIFRTKIAFSRRFLFSRKNVSEK